MRLQTVLRNVNTLQLAQVLNDCLSVRLAIHHDRVLATMREGAAVNGAALRALPVLFPNLIDITCFAHALNNAGQHLQFDILEDFGLEHTRRLLFDN